MPRGLVGVHGNPDGSLTMLAAPGYRLSDYERAIDHTIYGMFCHLPVDGGAPASVEGASRGDVT